MKIGIDISVLNDSQKTGVAVYTYNLIDNLLKINKKDNFILFGISTFETNYYLKNIDFKKYDNVTLKIYKLPARLFRTAFITWQRLNWPTIEDLIGEVDLFHSFNWYLPPQKKGKVVATVFDTTSLINPLWHDQRTTQLDSLRMERIKDYADLVIAISENSKKDFLKFSPKSNIEVVYPAASKMFRRKISNQKASKYFKKYNLQPGYILSVSTLEPRKNLTRLIQAYLNANLTQKLVLVGGWGWKNDEIVELIKDNQERIKLLGFVPDEDLPSIYQNALFLVYPSLYEGFGIPIIEAMNLGTPVICSNTASMPEAGGDGVFYIDPYKFESIKEALVQLTGSIELRKKLTKQGIKQASKFSWKKSAEKLNALYQRL